jgi:hypothetical protein
VKPEPANDPEALSATCDQLGGGPLFVRGAQSMRDLHRKQSAPPDLTPTCPVFDEFPKQKQTELVRRKIT